MKYSTAILAAVATAATAETTSCEIEPSVNVQVQASAHMNTVCYPNCIETSLNLPKPTPRVQSQPAGEQPDDATITVPSVVTATTTVCPESESPASSGQPPVTGVPEQPPSSPEQEQPPSSPEQEQPPSSPEQEQPPSSPEQEQPSSSPAAEQPQGTQPAPAPASEQPQGAQPAGVSPDSIPAGSNGNTTIPQQAPAGSESGIMQGGASHLGLSMSLLAITGAALLF